MHSELLNRIDRLKLVLLTILFVCASVGVFAGQETRTVLQAGITTNLADGSSISASELRTELTDLSDSAFILGTDTLDDISGVSVAAPSDGQYLVYNNTSGNWEAVTLTGATIKALYEAEADTNAFTDAFSSKLAAIEASADVTDEANVTSALSGATLSNIGTPATDDQVLILDTSASGALKYTAASELLGGGGGAVDSVNGYTGVVVLDPDDLDDTATTNKFTSAADISKLAAIEASADVTDEANVTSALSGATLSNIGTPATDDQVLILDTSASGALKYTAASELLGASAMSDLTDVNLAGLADEQVLKYASASTEWVPTTIGTLDAGTGTASWELGNCSTNGGDYGLCIGETADSYLTGSVALGYGAIAGAASGFPDPDASVAIGYTASAANRHSTAIGNQTNASGLNGTAIGDQAVASGEKSVAIGNGASAASVDAIVVGTGTTGSYIASGSDYAIVIGADSGVPNAINDWNIVIGTQSSAQGGGGTAETQTIVIGSDLTITQPRVLDFGDKYLNLGQIATASLATASSYPGAIVYDSTTSELKFSDGSTWNALGAGSSVTSVFSRTGAVVSAASDYDASQVDNDSNVAGTYVSDALNTLRTRAFQLTGHIETPEDKTYHLIIDSAFAGTVTETTTKADTGTCTATFNINGTALGGTANSVSSTEQTQTHSTSNAFAVGDDLTMVISSNSSCDDVRFKLEYDRASD